eukprot:g19888.t1
MLSLERSPFFPDILLGVTDWAFYLFKDGLNEHLFMSSYTSTYYTRGVWSPTRPSVIFLGLVSGGIDIWDFSDHLGDIREGQKLAVGDAQGHLHIQNIPKNLIKPGGREKENMRKFLDREEKRVRYFQDVMRICYRSLIEVSRCRDLIGDMLSRRLMPTTVVLNAAIGVASALSAWEEALSYNSLAKEFSLEPDLFTLSNDLRLFQQSDLASNTVTDNAAISAFAAGGDWQGALAMLSHMDDADDISYVAAISACRSERNWQLALQLLRRCPGNVVACSAAIAHRTGPAPNVVTYNSLISACGKGQQWLHAIHLLAEARQAKLRPGIVALNSATTACEKGRQWQHAEQLLRNGEAAGLKLDIIGFSAATSACEKGWEWNRAVGLLQEIRQRQLLEVVSCNAALSACGQCSQTRAALAIFRSMRKDSREVCVCV